jgi:hypothetical protein
LRKIYGFAEWCFEQKAKDLWNAAGVAFYEHLFDRREYRDQVVPWLSPQVIKGCWGLWELMLTPEQLSTVRLMIDSKHTKRFREARATLHLDGPIA